MDLRAFDASSPMTADSKPLRGYEPEDRVEGGALAPASYAAKPSPRSRELASSSELAWQSILVRAYVVPDETEGVATAVTPDMLVSLNIGGPSFVESQRAGGWSKARPMPDTIGTMAPGCGATLRWRSESPDPTRLLHMFLSASLLQETAEELGRPRLFSLLPDVLALEDPVVAAMGRALLKAVQLRADALHADTLAQSLALHLLYGRLLANGLPRSPRSRGTLTATELECVVDYMHANLDKHVVLEDLSTVASISKFHFVRSFKAATGEPPHRYLTRLRMHRAAELLRHSEDTVLQIATACGYSSPGQFATVFRRHFGANPTRYRHQTGLSTRKR